VIELPPAPPADLFPPGEGRPSDDLSPLGAGRPEEASVPGRAVPAGSGNGAAANGDHRPDPVRPAVRVRLSTIEEIEQLERYLHDHPGPRRVCAHVVSGDGEHVVPVRSGAHDVDELQQSLEQLFGEGNVWEE
jgi:hypothetical protein